MICCNLITIINLITITKEGFRLMKNGYYAGIDVGTNAGRLVIKDVYQNQKGQIVSARIQEIRIPLRLGADVFSTGSISFRKEEQLVDTMRAFRSLMNIYGVIDYRAYATSAMREAKNGSDIIGEFVRKPELICR